MKYGRALLLTAALLSAPPAAAAERLRVAAFDLGMSRDGPGVLVHELEGAPEPAALAAAAVVREVRPDVMLVLGFDYDLEGRALVAFRALLWGPQRVATTFRKAPEFRAAFEVSF